MRSAFLFLVGFFISCISLQAQPHVPDDNDNQFWNETQISIPISRQDDKPKLSFLINGNLRLGGNMGRFVDERIGFGFEYKLNKYVSLTPTYTYIAQQPLPSTRLYENRFRFAVGLEKSWKKFSIDDRNLIEYRSRNNVADSVRYRNRLRFVHPIKKGDKEFLAPFVLNEIFYDFRAKAFSRYEIAVGVTRKLNRNISKEVFYMWQTNRSGSPKQLNVIGVNLKIKLD